MNDLPGYARAQREWEDREPPSGGPCPCAECNGYGVICTLNAVGDDEESPCIECDGKGYFDESGRPCLSPREQADLDAYNECERADYERDRARYEKP